MSPDISERSLVEAIGCGKKFRTALISAAVTGKIDVRKFESDHLQEGHP